MGKQVNRFFESNKYRKFFGLCVVAVVFSFLTSILFFLMMLNEDIGEHCSEKSAVSLPFYVFQIEGYCMQRSYAIWNAILGAGYLSFLTSFPFLVMCFCLYRLFSEKLLLSCRANVVSAIFVAVTSVFLAYGYTSGLWVNAGGGEYCRYDDVASFYVFLHGGVPCHLTFQFILEISMLWLFALLVILLGSWRMRDN